MPARKKEELRLIILYLNLFWREATIIWYSQDPFIIYTTYTHTHTHEYELRIRRRSE